MNTPMDSDMPESPRESSPHENDVSVLTADEEQVVRSIGNDVDHPEPQTPVEDPFQWIHDKLHPPTPQEIRTAPRSDTESTPLDQVQPHEALSPDSLGDHDARQEIMPMMASQEESLAPAGDVHGATAQPHLPLLPTEAPSSFDDKSHQSGRGISDGSYNQQYSRNNSLALPLRPTMHDGIPVLPRVEESHFRSPPFPPYAAPAPVMMVGGKRKVHLRLEEEIQQHRYENGKRPSFLGHLRSRSKIFGVSQSTSILDRGHLTVSWFEGTSSLELQEHVRQSVLRRLKQLDPSSKQQSLQISEIRILDESVDPPEEIVLSPYIPDGSSFLLRVSTKDSKENDGASTPGSQYSTYSSMYRAPLSPSAAPSPKPRRDTGLTAQQLLLLRQELRALRTPAPRKTSNADEDRAPADYQTPQRAVEEPHPLRDEKKDDTTPATPPTIHPLDSKNEITSKDEDDVTNGTAADFDEDEEENMMRHSDDPIEARLRQITELLITDRNKQRRRSRRVQDEKQVIFVLANYFVLFLSIIAISAEIQARAPDWAAWTERQLQKVNSCAADQDALFQCVSNGDVAGLVASVILWLSRSVATRRIFLFGFDTPKKLWTVVYESLVTAFCWGVSYMFIRRGLNPDTRTRFLQKYWKDAVYGSLAGFNAAFMKQILKNLIPQEAVEDAFKDRHLKILSWLPSFE